MNLKIVCLGILLIELWFFTTPAAEQRGASVAKTVLPGVYLEDTNGQFTLPAPAYSPELWPGVLMEGTNGWRVQLACWDTNTTDPLVSVAVGSTNFNTFGSYYFGPPNGKFSKLELRDSDGIVVPPIRGVSVEGQVPLKISLSDLPRWPDGGLRNRIAFFTNSAPAPLREFRVRDVYRIEKEGDYALTVCAVIYKFAEDRSHLNRIDLPCVSTTIHLRQNDFPAASSGSAVIGTIVGSVFCVLGVIWLLSRRKRVGRGANPGVNQSDEGTARLTKRSSGFSGDFKSPYGL
jgi:hypothetical protein